MRSGDGDLSVQRRRNFVADGYMLTVVHRIAEVDTDRWERFEAESPQEAKRFDADMRKIYGGSWDEWWLKTVRNGVVWCNCPHFHGLEDGLKVEDLTFVEIEARRRIREALAYARAPIPGFEKAYLLDTGPQIGIRQTRLLQGEHMLTKEDIFGRKQFQQLHRPPASLLHAVPVAPAGGRREPSPFRGAATPPRRKPSGQAARSRHAKSWGRPLAPPPPSRCRGS